MTSFFLSQFFAKYCKFWILKQFYFKYLHVVLHPVFIHIHQYIPTKGLRVKLRVQNLRKKTPRFNFVCQFFNYFISYMYSIFILHTKWICTNNRWIDLTHSLTTEHINLGWTLSQTWSHYTATGTQHWYIVQPDQLR